MAEIETPETPEEMQARLEREQRMQEYHDEPWLDPEEPKTEDETWLVPLIVEYIRAQRAGHRLYPEHWAHNLARHILAED